MSGRVRIGELLINAGLLRRDQLDDALEQQRSQGAGGRRLGQLLVDLGFVAEVQLTKVLSQQLSVPWVSLHHIDFSRQLLNLVPRELADEFCVVPVYVRQERKVGDTLYLAMDDPTHDDAIRQVMAASGMPVKAMIAAPSDIRAAIRAFYAGGTASSPPPAGDNEPELDRTATTTLQISRPRPRTGPRPQVDAAKAAPAPAPIPSASAPPPTEPRVIVDDGATDRAAKVTVPERPTALAEAPSEPTPASAALGDDEPIAAKPAARMLALTLLDGTTIQIPSQRRRAASSSDAPATAPAAAATPAAAPAAAAREPMIDSGEDRLTTRDLIAALRAVADGADRGETLGDAGWETLLAALLSLLIKKQLIADWEFVEEWQRH